MSKDIKVSMIATDGKVRWVDQDKSSEFVERGWRMVMNPKETYYPQYDQALNKKPVPDDVGNAMRVIDDDKDRNKLGIIVL